MAYSLLWVMQDFYHQPYAPKTPQHPARMTALQLKVLEDRQLIAAVSHIPGP